MTERSPSMDVRGRHSPRELKPGNRYAYTTDKLCSNRYNVPSAWSLLMTYMTCRHHLLFQTLTHALFDLASMPQYIQPLRKEIESVIATDGWTKLSMDKMWKLDSFLKESQRHNGLGLGMNYSTLKSAPPCNIKLIIDCYLFSSLHVAESAQRC